MDGYQAKDQSLKRTNRKENGWVVTGYNNNRGAVQEGDSRIHVIEAACQDKAARAMNGKGPRLFDFFAIDE